jgi:serine/threonine protein kinase
MKINTGGKVIASGGYGCVFSPALKCEGTTKREKGKISKLMTSTRAKDEYAEIISIKEKLDKIENYKDYFLIYDLNLCKPAKLTPSDLKEYSKCSALPKDKITVKNINKRRNELISLNLPNGGLPVDDYLYVNGSFEKIYKLHLSLFQLLKEGIVPMNQMNVYHSDIKDSNVLVDDSTTKVETTKVDTTKVDTRLIDWGLANQYKPFQNEPFPRSWRNRPFQYNVPFSVIIFSDSFIERYTEYIKNGGNFADYTHLKPFVIDYINFWFKKRGAGHYKFINEIMYTFFSKNLTSVSSENKPLIIETQITMEFIVNYIVDVLVHFTKFREDGKLNLREYLDKVFIKIVDIWGFITVYYPLAELLYNNYDKLNIIELRIFNKIKFLFVTYLFNPRHTPIDMNMLYSDLNDLGNLINIKLRGKRFKNIKSVKMATAAGIHKKTRKNARNNAINNANTINNINTNNGKTFSFKRRPKRRKFRNPIFYH